MWGIVGQSNGAINSNVSGNVTIKQLVNNNKLNGVQRRGRRQRGGEGNVTVNTAQQSTNQRNQREQRQPNVVRYSSQNQPTFNNNKNNNVTVPAR